MTHADRFVITAQDVDRFRQRAEQCRAEAESIIQSALRDEHLATARAYDRMADRAERFVSGG